jgi:hypothetical protein
VRTRTARARRLWASCAVAAAIAWAAPAGAVDFFDGKLEVHGWAGQQIRTLGENLSYRNEFDLSQWYNVLSLEVEAKPFPNGVGPLEIVEFFVRGEARYDCVWTRACGLFPSVNTYGNRAEHLPDRLIDGRYRGFAGALEDGDRRYFTQVDRTNFELDHRNDPLRNDQEPLHFQELPGLVSAFGLGTGPNMVLDPITRTTGDDPGPYQFWQFIHQCKFAARNERGGENGQIINFLGPWNPSCNIRENGALRHNPNPFSPFDLNQILMGVDRTPGTGDEPIDDATDTAVIPTGRNQLPYRPAPFWANSVRGLDLTQAQGLYVPSHGLVRELQKGTLDSIDQNFGQQELAWNHGASQQDEKELKEAYVDIEALEGRLWMRLGKQTIVWGKTELFRNTDQFNPQDFSLASIPDLESSRIALWSARGTYSFYNWGKLEDVRLELAVNLDNPEAADLGRCGEPYAVEAVCGLTFGYFAHGFTGAGLAGRDEPPAWWQDPSGLEGGARLEWRYKRFSFQLSDFYGYDDFPYPRRISTFERNVDPDTGRPRRLNDRGPCTTGAEPACLGRPNGVKVDATGTAIRLADTNGDGVPDTEITCVAPCNATRPIAPTDVLWTTGQLIIDPAQQADVLQFHSANQTLFAVSNILCGVTIVDAALCGTAALNGHSGPGATLGTTVAGGASSIIAGGPLGVNSGAAGGFLCYLGKTINIAPCRLALGGTPGVPGSAALALINLDPGDDVGAFSDGGPSAFARVLAPDGKIGQTLGGRLTPQQEALWGCGPYYQSDCDVDGVDFLNAEGSVILQSWPGFDGTHGSVDTWDVRLPGQPGTMGFRGGPVATRYVNGHLVILPGARGPADPGYDPTVDGCVMPMPGHCSGAHDILHPFSHELFRSEVAATSWNFLVAVVAGSRQPINPALPTISEFDPYDPYGFGLRGTPSAYGIGGTNCTAAEIGVSPNCQPRPGINVDLALEGEPTACGLLKPTLCQSVVSFLGIAGARRNSVKAGGANGFGRRDFVWDSGGELVLDYQRRNVLGFAFDFDEDHTKSNWGVEASWINNQPFLDANSFSNISKVGTLNLTISVDRPTFINFLNPGRTFFFNSQIFVQYINDYGSGFASNGPVNLLATLTVFTGYFQDRLMFYHTAVYDVNSQSGALLPSISYRFNEAFSVTVGANVFWGHQQLTESALNELRPGLNRVGHDAYEDPVENGLAAVRERDEVYMLLRYTF